MRCKSIWILLDILELRFRTQHFTPTLPDIEDDLETAFRYYLYRAYHLQTRVYHVSSALIPLYEAINRTMENELSVVAREALSIGYNNEGLQHAIVDVQGNDLWICLTNSP